MVSEASATVVINLRDYELVLILRPELSEEQAETVINNISQFVTTREGVVASLDKWGKRRLSYPIKHCVDGNYVLAKFKMKNATGRELENNLRINDNVIRHLLIKIES